MHLFWERLINGMPSLHRPNKGCTSGGKHILVIDFEVPRFDTNSGGLRMFEMLKLLRGMEWDVTFIPYDLQKRSRYANKLENIGIRFLFPSSIRRHLKEEGNSYNAILTCRAYETYTLLPAFRRFAPQAQIIFDTVDVHHLRMERKAHLHDDAELHAKARRWKRRELDLMQQADCTLVVSEEEKKYLQNVVPDVDVHVVSNIHTTIEKPRWDDARKNILFLGNFHHEPNRDALEYFVRDIFPLIRAKNPDVVLDVIGDMPHDSIEYLATSSIRIHGYVPDLTPLFATAFASIAPLRFGAGVKGKLHMSMSYGVPCVTTSIGAEGMHVEHGKHMLIADEPEMFAQQVIALHENRTLWQTIATNAQQVLEKYFSPQAARKNVEEMFEHLHRTSRNRDPRVLAVIPCGGKDPAMLRRCLATLHHASTGVSVRTVVILCPATKEKTAALRAVLPTNVELITLPAPFSFAASNNAGLALLRDEEYVLMLNDDCFFRGTHDLRSLIAALHKKNLACVGPWLHHQNFTSELPPEKKSWGVARTHRPLIGACLLWERKWLDRIGFFDESFSGYGMEEADLLYRLLDSGGRWGRFDRIIVDHMHHATFGGTIKDEEPHHRNLKRWAEKYPGVHSWGESEEWRRNLKPT